MSASQSANHNYLLSALPADESEWLAAHLQLVPLRLGDILYEPGAKLQHAYFPTSAIVSLHYVTRSCESAETAGVGNEGMVGVSLFMGGHSASGSATVHTAGNAYCLQASLLNQAFDSSAPVRDLLLRYTHTLITQISQTAACSRHHTVEQQLCSWLLVNLDRSPAKEMILTQELIAGVLGMSQENVAEVAERLQSAGFIRYRRTHFSVHERTGLERCACECYGLGKKELIRVLPHLQSR